MSRLFTYGQYLEATPSVPVTVSPFSIAGWFNCNTTAADRMLWGLVDKSEFDHSFNCRLKGFSTDVMRVRVDDGGSTVIVDTVNTYTVDAWQHSAFLEDGTSRALYLNGDTANKGTNGTTKTPTNIDSFALASQRITAAPGPHYTGLLAEWTVWNVLLLESDVVVLSLGFSPYFVKPQSIVSHYSLWGEVSPEQDIVGGVDLTLSGTPTQGDHYPMKYIAPSPFNIITQPAPPPSRQPRHGASVYTLDGLIQV